jgi:NTE family protein
VGTSAGSVVGAALGSADGLERLAATDWVGYGQELASYMAGLDQAAVARIDALWFGAPDGADLATRAEIGRLGRLAVTGPAERFEHAVAAILPDRTWPAFLRVTAVDAEDGQLRIFDTDSGVQLVQAVAASCAIPGVFPPIEIGGRRYIDGGVRTGSGLDLAAGSRWVVGVAPSRQDGHGERQLRTETAALEADGSAVILIRPGAEANAIFGVDSLDVGLLPEAVRVGRHAGRAAAVRLRAKMEA